MTQIEIDREVSRASGESMGSIRRRGFSILSLAGDHSEDEPQLLPLQIVDWDAVDATRRRAA